MRLLYLGDTASPHFRAWPEHFAAAGHEVHSCHLVRAPAGPPIEGVTAHPAPAALRPPVPRLWLAAAPALRRLARRLGPDVVHSHAVFAPGYLAELAGLAPHVCTAWGSEVLLARRRQRGLIRRVARGAELLTADSRHLLGELERLGASPQRLRWVPWGVSARWLAPARGLPRARAAEAAGLPTGRPLVLSHRGTRPLHRQDVFLRALARVRERVPEVLGVIIESTTADSRGDEVRDLAAELGLDDSILVRPWLAHERMPFAYRAARLCVSVTESDSAPTSVFEALALATPAVVSDLPWVREPVYRDAALRVVPVGDDDALAEAILSELQGDGGDGTVAERNVRLVAERFDRERIFAAVESDYERLAAEAA